VKDRSRVLLSVLFLLAIAVGALGAYAQEGPDAVVAAATWLRDKPHDTGGRPLEEMVEGEAITVLGRTRNGNWLYVEAESGAKGWLPVGDLTVNVDLESLEIVRSGQVEVVPPPPPTATLLNDAPLRDTAHAQVGEDIETLLEGEQAKILGRTRAGSFVYVETITGATGWLHLANADVNVNLDKLAVMQSGRVEIAQPMAPTFTVVGDATLRDTAHDSAGEDVATLWEGRTGTILGRTRGGNFLYVEMDSGATGWLHINSVETGFPTSRLSIEESGRVEIVSPPAALITAPSGGVEVFDKPHPRLRNVIDTLSAGETGAVLGRSYSGDHLYVATPNAAKGWVVAAEVELNVDMDILPVVWDGQVEIVPPAEPIATVIGEDLVINMRSGPHTTFDIVGTLRSGDEVELAGRSPSGDWLYVVSPTGRRGWVAAYLLGTDYPVVKLPLV
jgi:uncharacterized protein YgiM (DUF1202 family)